MISTGATANNFIRNCVTNTESGERSYTIHLVNFKRSDVKKLLTIFCLCVLPLPILHGCTQSKVQGGQTNEHHATFTIRYGDLWIAADGINIATTQPSIIVTGNAATPNIAPTTQPDDIGGVSFNPAPVIKKTFADRYAWALAGVFLLCAGFLFWQTRYLLGTIALAIGILSALNPIALMVGAGVVLAFTLYIVVRDMNQTAAGIKNAEVISGPEVDVSKAVREKTDAAVHRQLKI